MKYFFKTGPVLLVFFCVTALVGFSACAPKKSRAVSSDVTAEITLMMWSGDSKYWTDIGSRDLSPDDISSQNVAQTYATAKAFKKIYPNIKINVFAKTGGTADDMPWEQARENFRTEYGIYPDIYATTDLIGDIQRGLIADISIFRDDPMYKSFNPKVMALMNIEGRQFGLPQYLLPWGVYINKSLAEANNIDVPDPNWTIAEFTRFISHSRPNEFYGIMGDYDIDQDLINTGTKDFTYMLFNHKGSGPFVNINSDATRSVLRYLSQWASHAVLPNFNQGKVSSEFMETNWWWSYKFFLEGKLLSCPGDPWMMGDAAHPNPEHWGSVKAADWDIYPRPSTDYMDNTVGIVLDPFVIRNYAMDDGDPRLSAEEEEKLRIAWEFAKFWCGDIRAWEARAAQTFRDGNAYKSAPTDSFPLVTGEEFNRQMEIWYTTETHQRFKDKSKMPGFHYILDLWEKGQFWDVSDKAYPWYFDFEGSRRAIDYEWENAHLAEVSGAYWYEPNWLDQVFARLPDWNAAMNQRWENETRKLMNALNRYYPEK
ncbi:MAG: extracellular solute-binding protein [Treponema sp.]|jgi:maltose-binding protein MalE|nr:extracellular solute-binding protein [Treponema sp.]